MQSYQIKHTLILVFTALIWGCCFVAQSIGADYVGAFTFLSTRSWIACAVLLPVIRIIDRTNARRGKRTGAPATAQEKKMLCLGGLICGVLLFAASAAQQIGIETTTTAKAGFLTALYVILVPLLSRFFGKKVGGQIWFCVTLVLVGLYLLCIRDTLRLEWGDSMVLLCALLFALQIMAVDYFSPHVDGVRLACSQFFVTAVLSTICALLFEHVTLSDLRLAAPAILYAGLLSSAVGYTLQIVGQKGLNPTIASLAMCLESVFSALGGWLILHEVLTSREKLGAVLMFSAIVLAQIPLKKTSSKEEST